MIRATVGAIAGVTGASLACGPTDRQVAGVCIDSRAVSRDCAFVAFPGERVDGNDFVASALGAGAALAVMTREPSEAEVQAAREGGTAVLVTPDPERFLQDLAGWWRDQVGCLVVGVTGSSGKTTTRTMVASVLSQRLRTHTATGNHNNLIGVPMTVLACPADAQAMVVEMGMSARGEIARLCQFTRPDLAVITNVGVAHLEDLGSRDEIARAKAEIIDGLRPSDAPAPTGVPATPAVFLWAEDDYCGWMEDRARERGVRAVTFGLGQQAQCRAAGVELDGVGRAQADLALPDGASLHARLAIAGRHNVLNALAAAAVGREVGLAPEEIARGLAQAQALRLHQRVVRGPGGFTLIDDSYNGNTDSVRRALEQLTETPGRRRVACLGDMLGLGPDKELQHAAVGAYAAGRGVDVLVCVGPLSRSTAKAARYVGMPASAVLSVDGPDQAARALHDIVREGDVVLAIASHATGLERVVASLLGEGDGRPAAGRPDGAAGADSAGDAASCAAADLGGAER